MPSYSTTSGTFSATLSGTTVDTVTFVGGIGDVYSVSNRGSTPISVVVGNLTPADPTLGSGFVVPGNSSLTIGQPARTTSQSEDCVFKVIGNGNPFSIYVGEVTQSANFNAAPLNSAPVVVSGTSETLTAANNGQTRRYTNASLVTVTLPTDAAEDLIDGFWTLLVCEGVGGLTLNTTGITLPTGTLRSVSRGQGMLVLKTAAANTWIVLGGTF